MVAGQIEARGIQDPAILEAMREIPRERFVPAKQGHLAWADQPVPIGHGQTISQPYVVAMTLQALKVSKDHVVLDVGAGSGYQTALLAKLCKQVYAIERLEALADAARERLEDLGIENTEIVCGDGTMGLPEHAPFDRIVCAAAGPEVPDAWIKQLAQDGRIVAPIGPAEAQKLCVLTKYKGKILQESLGDVRFVKLIGQGGWPQE